MKKLFTFILSLCIITIYAQNSGGPGPYGYTWVNSDTSVSNHAIYNWIDIEAPENYVDGLGDDNIVGPFNIAPAFQYYWYTVDKIWVGSNGYISFSPTQISSPFPSMPTNSFAKSNFIAGFMCDLNFAPDTTTVVPGGISANTARCYMDDSPSRTVISYINVPFWMDPSINPISGQEWTGYNTFQIVLNKLDSTIQINYKDRDIWSSTNSNDIEVGIQSKVGMFGLQHTTGTYFNSFTSSGMPCAIRYDLPTNPSSITDVSVNWNDNDENKGIFLSADGSDYLLQSNIKNEGNTLFNGASVISNVSPQFSPPAVSNNATLNPLPATDDTTFLFTNKFQPTSSVLGPHTFKTMLSGAVGDMDPNNNSLDQEIVVVDTTQTLINLSYAFTTGGGSINWSGGNGGVAVYLKPPFYPCVIKNSNFYIETNTLGASFAAKIYDDNGLNGGPGTLLDSVTVPGSMVLSPANNIVPLATPDTLYDGGVYVLWYMGGDGIGLGKDITPPISIQTYEVLSNFWATYRAAESEDFFISIDIEKLPLADDVGVSTIITPANNNILFSAQNVEVEITNYGLSPTTPFDVNYQFNNGAIITETVTNAIASGATYNHVFTTQIGPMSIGAPAAPLCAWTSYSLDPNSTNNQDCNTQNAPTTSVELTIMDKIEMYPNPTNRYLYFENLPNEKITISILDISGKECFVQELKDGFVDINFLVAGVYQVKLKGKEWEQNRKLVKQ